MITAKPEKPWKNIAPKPDPDRLLTLDPRNIGSVEEKGPGVEYAFDADRSMIDAAAQNDAELQPLREACNRMLDALTAAIPGEPGKAD